MSLSLNGWPPIASHMIALLVGMSLVHLSIDRDLSQQVLSDNSRGPQKAGEINLYLEGKQVLLSEPVQTHKLKNSPKIPAQVKRIVDSSGRCYLSAGTFKVSRIHSGYLIQTELQRASELQILGEQIIGKKSVHFASPSGDLKKCGAQTGVFYE